MANARRWGALITGAVLFAGAINYVNFHAVYSVRGLVALPLALLVSGLWHVSRTWAWASCFEVERPDFRHLARVRLAAEAFSYLTLSGVAGDPMKVLLLRGRVDPRDATAAVMLERLAYIAGTTIIVGAGSLMAMLALPLSAGWYRVFRAFTLTAALTLLLVASVVRGRGRYLYRCLALCDEWFGTTWSRGRVGRFVLRVEDQFLGLVRGNPRRLGALMIATLASYALMVLEAWLILTAYGSPVRVSAAVAVETFSRAASFASAFIPANLGALEASSVAATVAVGMAGAGGALALVRRIRGLFWAGVGLALYPRASLDRADAPAADRAGVGERLHGAPAILCVLRDRRVSVSPHVRLAGLPLSERVLRAALRAHPEAVVLVWTGEDADRTWSKETPTLERAFERTVARLGDRVRLVRDPASWATAVKDLTAVTVIGPGTLVSPALFERAFQEPVDPAATIVDVAAGPGWPVSGVLRMRGIDAADVTVLADALHVRTADKKWPSGEDVAAGEVRLALRMTTDGDVPAAEKILRRSTYKNTDAKLARFNRRMSLPISVRLIPTPLTANQLSLGLVAIGLYSAWLFSIGAYWSGVLGAFLSLAASVLDGCDGEIARLKYQESALGCWIETIGDYSYYLAIFVGLTVGAERQTGWPFFYWIGTAALTGTLVSFALLIYLRSRITNGQPDRLHAIAKARFKAEPTFWSRIVWRVSFVATRAAMPYGIMALAIINLLPLVVLLAAVGANVYWISLVLKLRDLLAAREPLAA